MKLDNFLLMACVDGNLSPQNSEGLKQAIARSDRVRRCVALLQASRLPYQRAYKHLKTPPVPPKLVRRIEEMCQAASTSEIGQIT
jgi:anti-sigma factor RsiW